MSAAHLPDDLVNWPSDPYLVLDVPYGVSRLDLRRAYTRLIRIYKPEQYPEQCRRLREAYEQIQQELPSPREPDSPSPPSFHITALPVRHSVPSGSEELESLWPDAATGTASAYTRLVHLAQEYPRNADIYARLYWLLRYRPGLDPNRTAADWIVKGLSATGLSWTLINLYIRMIQNNPEMAFTEYSDRLLEVPAPGGQLVDLASGRLRAAVRLNRWGTIEADLEILHNRLVEERALWLRVLYDLFKTLCWTIGAEAKALRDRIYKNIRKMEYIALEFPDFFDRADHLREAAQEWGRGRNNRQISPHLLEVLALSSGTASPAWERRTIHKLVSKVVRDPVGWLAAFDDFRKLAPYVFAFLDSLLQPLVPSSWGGRSMADPRDVARLTMTFLHTGTKTRYPSFRNEFLGFCLREALDPSTVADVMAAPPEEYSPLDAVFLQKIQDDWPLRHVCQAHRIFWG